MAALRSFPTPNLMARTWHLIAHKLEKGGKDLGLNRAEDQIKELHVKSEPQKDDIFSGYQKREATMQRKQQTIPNHKPILIKETC